MDHVARLPRRDRAELFEETANQLGIGQAVIVEKDFWVCWILGRLFALPGAHPDFVFKGGTSLSKVFGLIQRFSEDIDISIDWRGLGFVDARDPATAGTNRRKRLLHELGEACATYVASDLAPVLRRRIEAVLGKRTVRHGISSDPDPGGGWALTIDPDAPQTLLFAYPPTLVTSAYVDFSYIRPIVRLEFGARGEQWPAGEHTVTSYAAQVFPDQFVVSAAAVRTLDAERTFWEKATILHAWAYRGTFPGPGERWSRHYYDLAMLSRSPVRTRALADPELLIRVAMHKQRFYPAAASRYELARPGTLRLLPDDDLLPALRADYAGMREMIFGDAPPLTSVLDELRGLEAEIESASRVRGGGR